jgi:IS30 family transposase
MATHAAFKVDDGAQLSFCEPQHPWQRGTDENANGLLRKYLPRSLVFSELSEAYLDAIAEHNGRPRETLGVHVVKASRRTRCNDRLSAGTTHFLSLRVDSRVTLAS